MDAERWNRMSSVFITARERPSGERAAFLAEVCGNDRELRQEVESMLAADAVGSELRLERGVLGAFSPGTRLGPYLIESLVAEGGMGEVYRAERVDGAYQKTVAIKVLRPGYRTAEAVRRFRLERQVLARLEHPDIAAILDGGTTHDGRPYLVLQFVDGVPITDFCQSLPVAERLKLLARVARVVQFAHGRLIVHRDLKPSNILVQADGSPRLLDFGIAKLLDPDAEEGLRFATRPDTRLLTPEHAAPEQLRGEPVSTATDVYALGVLLYTLLSGRRPYPVKGRPLHEVETSILEDDAPPPSSVTTDPIDRKAVTQDLDRITLMAIRKEPDRRYLSAEQFAEDLDRYLAGQPVLAGRDTLGYRSRKFITRNRGWVALGAGIAFLLLYALGSTWYQGKRISAERDRAEKERAVAEDMVGMLTDLFRRVNPRVNPGGDTVRVTALLDDAEKQIEKLTEHPDRQARIMRVIGNVRSARGQYVDAEKLLRSSWDWHRINDSLSPDAARVYFELTRVEYNLHGSGRSQPMLDTVLSLLRRNIGPYDSTVAQALRMKAFSTDNRKERLGLLDEAVAVQRRQSGVDSIGIAEQLDSEGAELFNSGRYVEAAASYEQALRIVERLLPPGHPDRLTVAGNLATALGNTADLERADSMARVILRDHQRFFPGKDGEAFAHSRLGSIAAKMGRHDVAETEFRAGLEILRQSVDPAHERIWSELRNLGVTVARRGRIDEGLSLLDSAYRRGVADRGKDAVGPAYILGQRGYVLLWSGRNAEAASAINEAARVVLNFSSEGHPYRPDVLFWQGLLAYAQGDYRESVAKFSSSLEQPSGDLLDTMPYRAQIGCALGTALVKVGRNGEAKPLLARTCPVFDRHAAEQPLLGQWSRNARARLGIAVK